MGDHLGIIIFSSIFLILLNSPISLRELYKTKIISFAQSHVMQKNQPAICNICDVRHCAAPKRGDTIIRRGAVFYGNVGTVKCNV